MKLGVSPLAEQDLEAIGDYIAQDNPVWAVSFMEELYHIPAVPADSGITGALQRAPGAGAKRQKLCLRLIPYRVPGA